MNIDERYRAAEDEAQLEYIKQWRERKRKKEDRRKDYWMEAVWHLRMFFDMLFKSSLRGDNNGEACTNQ